MLLMMATGCGKTEKQEEEHSSTVITSGGEVISAYRDGKDVTDERKALEEQTEDVISRFLNRDKEELEFSMFCMLEMDGMSIEVIVDEVSYTFFCSMQGDIISAGRTDGETFDLRGGEQRKYSFLYLPKKKADWHIGAKAFAVSQSVQATCLA